MHIKHLLHPRVLSSSLMQVEEQIDIRLPWGTKGTVLTNLGQLSHLPIPTVVVPSILSATPAIATLLLATPFSPAYCFLNSSAISLE